MFKSRLYRENRFMVDGIIKSMHKFKDFAITSIWYCTPFVPRPRYIPVRKDIEEITLRLCFNNDKNRTYDKDDIKYVYTNIEELLYNKTINPQSFYVRHYVGNTEVTNFRRYYGYLPFLVVGTVVRHALVIGAFMLVDTDNALIDIISNSLLLGTISSATLTSITDRHKIICDESRACSPVINGLSMFVRLKKEKSEYIPNMNNFLDKTQHHIYKRENN